MRIGLVGKALIGLLIGAVLTPVAAYLAIASGAGGEGDYGLAKLVLPYAMMALQGSGSSQVPAVIALALVQWPLYGLAVGVAGANGRGRLTTAAVLVVHVLAVLLAWGMKR